VNITELENMPIIKLLMLNQYANRINSEEEKAIKKAKRK